MTSDNSNSTKTTVSFKKPTIAPAAGPTEGVVSSTPPLKLNVHVLSLGAPQKLPSGNGHVQIDSVDGSVYLGTKVTTLTVEDIAFLMRLQEDWFMENRAENAGRYSYRPGSSF